MHVQRTTLFWQEFKVIWSATLLLAAFLGCTGGNDAPQEPVAPEAEATSYPEDPDLAGQPEPDTTAPSNEADLPGELTDDPFAGSPPVGDDRADIAVPPAEVPAIPEPEAGSDETYGDAFDDKPGYDPAQDEAVTAPAPETVESDKTPPPGAPIKIKRTLKGGKSGTRYVNALQLNVRASANLRAPITRRLLGGTKVTATIKGEWAQLADGAWVRSKYLSTKPTKKVTDDDVARAWKASKYKDTWQPEK